MNRLVPVLVVVACVLGGLLWYALGRGGEPAPAPAPTTVDESADPTGPAGADDSPPVGESGAGVRTEARPDPPAPSAPAPRAGSGLSDSILTGRLVRADRQPVRDATCAGWIRRGHEYRHLETSTNGDGRFAVAAPPDFDGPGRMLVLRARSPERVEAAWHRAEVGLPHALQPGETWLGDLEVAELPLLVAGTVTGPTPGDGAGTAVFAMPAGLSLTEMRNRRLPDGYRCETDAAGRFCIFGAGAGPHIVVAKRAGACQSAVPTFEPGATDVEVVLEPAGSVAGSVELTGNFDPRHVHVELSGAPVEGHIGSLDEPVLSTLRPIPAGGVVRLSLDSGGAFGADLLRPGVLTCSVFVRGRVEPVRVFDDVRIVAGDTTRDPRLQRIDLSELQTFILLFVAPVGGPPVSSMPVGIRESGQQQWGRRTLAEGGTLIVSTTSGAFDVLAQQRGYRRQLIENVRTDRTIDLELGLEARVTVHLGEALPPGFEATVRLVGEVVDDHPEYEHVEVPRSDEVLVTDANPVALTVPAPGRYRVKVRVRTIGGPRDERMDVVDPTPAEIVVPAGGISEPVEIRLGGRAAYRAARTILHFFPR